MICGLNTDKTDQTFRGRRLCPLNGFYIFILRPVSLVGKKSDWNSWKVLIIKIYRKS